MRIKFSNIRSMFGLGGAVGVEYFLHSCSENSQLSNDLVDPGLHNINYDNFRKLSAKNADLLNHSSFYLYLVKTGDSSNNLYAGGGGADTLTGGSGNDTLSGGGGNDVLYGDADADSLKGEAGNDTLYGGPGNDYLDGGDDNDTLVGDSGNDTINGGIGNDTMYGGVGNDSLKGGAGSDTLAGADNDDWLHGEAGNDILYGDGGNDGLSGGGNNDTLYGGTGNDSLYGNDGNDSLDGGENDDALIGGDDNDTLIGYTGNDSIYGDGGIDRLEGGIGNDLLSGGDNNDYLIGDADEDVLYGDAGADSLNGGSENDTLYGATGNDTLNGDSGDDVLYGDDNNDSISGGIGRDRLYGGSDNDTLLGGDNNDGLTGGSGDDSLEGGDGNDILYGDTGADTLDGGIGNDTFYIDNINDKIVEGKDKGTDKAVVSVKNYFGSAFVENYEFIGDGSLVPGFIRSILYNGNTTDLKYGGVKIVYYYWNSNPKLPSVEDKSNGIFSNARGMTEIEKKNSLDAMNKWADVSNIKFEYSNNGSGISFSAADTPNKVGGSWSQSSNSIIISSDKPPGLSTYIHEIGHALGFKHPNSYNDDGGYSPPPYLDSGEDFRYNTIMSYNGTRVNELGVYDIAAIQYLYGPNTSKKTGDDIYNISSKDVGNYIWDGAGNDTISAASSTESVNIDLRDGSWGWFGNEKSSLFKSEKQFFIGFGTVIENAFGGFANDTLKGNKGNNVLSASSGNDELNGFEGNDTLDGGSGTDTAVFSGNYADYKISVKDNQVRVQNKTGDVDTLISIEKLKFDDQTVDAPATTSPSDTTPIITITVISAIEGTGNGTGRLVFTISLSEAATAAVTFTARTQDGTAKSLSDYTPVDGSFSIAVGSKSTNVTINVRPDGVSEGNETIKLIISNIKGAHLVDGSSELSAFGTVIDDDGAQTTTFTLDAYRALNPDISAAFGSDDLATAWHYVNHGKSEGRKVSGFDVDAYAALNPDLFRVYGLNEAALINHYQRFGKTEGRSVIGFDADAYAALNPDLFNAFGVDHALLIRHYINNGKAEGRAASGFNAEAYAALNPDLFAAFGLDESALIRHYITTGKAEGRQATGFDAETYAVLNPDLLSVFGLTHASLINHYQYAGRVEGRSTTLPVESASLAILGITDDTMT